MGKAPEPAEVLSAIGQAAGEITGAWKAVEKKFQEFMAEAIWAWAKSEMEKLYLADYRQRTQGLWLI